MTYQEIEAFLAICRYKSISRAAEELFITQSALSIRLKTLEENLGCSLLLRSKGKREITLTDRGQSFYELALQYQDIVQKMDTMNKQAEAKELRLSATNSVGNYLFPPVLELFLNTYPDIALTMQDMDTKMACNSILRGKIDMAFSIVKVQTDQIASKLVLDDPFVVICAPNSPYPEMVTLADLPAWDEVYIKWSSDYEFWHQATFGTNCQTQFHLSMMGQIELFVTRPHKWALVPKSIAANLCPRSNLRQCIPTFDIPDRSIYLLRHRDKAETDTMKCFLDIFREVLAAQNMECLL